MMHWNHRVFRSKTPEGEWLSIRETFYDETGTVNGWTADEITPAGETLDELRETLERMLKCLDQPVLDDTKEA